MKTALATLAMTLLPLPAVAADEKRPVDAKSLDASFLRLYAETRGFMLGRPTKPKPTPDGKAVLFLRSEPKKPKLSLFEFDVATGKTRELLTPEAVLKGAEEKLSAEEKARRERQRVSVGGFTDFQLTEDGTHVLLSLSGKLYVYDRAAAKVTELRTGKGTLLDPKFSRDGAKVAYVLDHDVFVYDLVTEKEAPVTRGGTVVKTHGLAEFVAQEEMGRFSGFWWSPDGKHIAYEEADHEGVEQWFVADPAKPGQKPLPQYYPRPGKKNVAVRLGIVPVTGGKTVWVDWDAKKYEYLAVVRWDKEGPLTIQVLDRKQQELVLLLVDPTTGKTTKLVEEKDPAFVNLRQDVPRWLPNSRGFLWVSETGEQRPQFQRRFNDGGMAPGIYADEREFASLISVDTSGKYIACKLFHFVQGSGSNRDRVSVPSGQWIWELTAGGMALVSEPMGTSDAVFSKDHSLAIVTQSELVGMPESTVYRIEHKGTLPKRSRVGELPSVAVEPPFATTTKLSFVGDPPGFMTAIVRPHDFDSKKKYPVILHVYGGPHHVTVLEAMRPWLLMQWLADQGFIVVAIDNRGTPGQGRDWERAIYQKFATVPLEDQVKGLKLLGAKHPEMDLERVGVVGWSFGGYMSALAVLKAPDVFKAAVAGAPVTDWEDYDTCYTERYLGLLPESQKAYDEANLVKMADQLTRPLLLVHGTADDNVYFRHTLRLTDALFRAGKEFEVLPLPSLTHMVPDPVVTERLWTRIAGHFQKHLGKPR
jgi:dipeptidyl-peptidase-4